MKIPATVRGHECASRNFEDTNAHQETCTKTLATKDTHISKSTKSCTKLLTQNCIRKKDHENTNYNPRTLIQINKHAQTHSLEWTCTNKAISAGYNSCLMSNFQIRTRTWSKLDSNSDHKNTRYSSRTRMRIKKRAQKHSLQKIRT
ncbi:hypothetical protein MIMGU_mgv11b020720mg [Erythranthe guttata]|uniref:Uncharacterized protein n=2 Tax=Erythranthe guttata TaxID=4155 RepID=A0A022RJ93_ERYGU|nr:hypothetical protein MIMGU_mgv11b020720mg [Erythranthe guttata]